MNDTELDEILDAWKAPAVPPSLRAGLRAKLPADRKRRVFGVPLRWVVACAFGAGAFAVGASLVESGALSSDAGMWNSSTYVRRTRIVQPPVARLKWMFMRGHSTGWQWQAGKLVGSVYLHDRWSREHYGYTWNARPLETGQFLFTVQPLDPSVVKEHGSIAPLAQSPPIGTVGAGSSFEVNLYASGNERVFDRIELSRQPLPVAGGQDSTQTALELALTNPNLYVNGQFASGPNGVGEAKGLTAYIELPGRGRYVLALASQGNPGLVQAGSVNGNVIGFHSEGDHFRIECSAPIAAGGTRPVFVFLRKGIPVRTPAFGSGGAPSHYR